MADDTYSNDQQSNEGVYSSKRPTLKGRNVKKIFVIVGLVVILGGVVAACGYIFKEMSQKSSLTSDHHSIYSNLPPLRQADLAMQGKDIEQLGKLIASFEKQSSSHDNIDQQYIAAYYYVQLGYPQKAQSALSTVNRLLEEGRTFDSQISDITNASTPKVLQQQIDGLKSQQPVTFGRGKG